MTEKDLFPPEEFDGWAETYDESVRPSSSFPFDGYEAALDEVLRQAEASSDMKVLDLGTGTGNLALRFARLGCNVWGTDFSMPMLEKARQKLPEAHFLQADLRQPWPPELNRRFERIVSGYVFHHFELPQKVEIARRLAGDLLQAGGRIVIADIAFQNRAALEAVKQAVGDEWEDEFYWLADEALAALREAGLQAEYRQVSSCAGVFCLF